MSFGGHPSVVNKVVILTLKWVVTNPAPGALPSCRFHHPTESNTSFGTSRTFTRWLDGQVGTIMVRATVFREVEHRNIFVFTFMSFGGHPYPPYPGWLIYLASLLLRKDDHGSEFFGEHWTQQYYKMYIVCSTKQCCSTYLIITPRHIMNAISFLASS